MHTQRALPHPHFVHFPNKESRPHARFSHKLPHTSRASASPPTTPPSTATSRSMPAGSTATPRRTSGVRRRTSRSSRSAAPTGGRSRRRRPSGACTCAAASTSPTDGYGWASGGYIADSRIDGTVGPYSQQQWYTRDSSVGGWLNAVWNMVFSGVEGAPAQSFPNRPARRWRRRPSPGRSRSSTSTATSTASSCRTSAPTPAASPGAAAPRAGPRSRCPSSTSPSPPTRRPPSTRRWRRACTCC
ncbi:hypothetical protein STENM327S_05192 [Streptomyces tendae]